MGQEVAVLGMWRQRSSLGFRARKQTHPTEPILNNTANVPDSNAATGRVQQNHIPLPRQRWIRSLDRRLLAQAAVEHACHDDKEAEDEDLQDQTAENNVLAQVDIALLLGVGEQPAAGALHEEAQDVAGDKDARDPLRADQRVRFGTAAPHDARQDHVDGSGEEDGREQDQ